MLIAWLKAHRILIAALSVVGSIAGLGFASADLHSALQEKRKKKV